MRLWLPILVAGALVAQTRPVEGPLVVSERWPQCTSLETWTADVIRLEGLQKASETAQGKAFFRWLRLFSRMATGGMIQAFEGDAGRERYVIDAHKNLFVYGWGYCDTTSRIAEAAWTEFKKDRTAAERVCVMHADGGYHTMYRLRLDGRYGAFDPRYGYYLIDKDTSDARVLDWAAVGRDENITTNRGYRNRSGPFFEYFGREWDRALLLQPTYFDTEQAWIAAGKAPENVFGNGQYVRGTRFHNMDFRLPKGTTIERFWDNSGRKFYVPKGLHTQREETFLKSGRFYRVTETMFDGNWPKHDPNYRWAKPYLAEVPRDEGYNSQAAGGRTIGQAWGRITWKPESAAGILDFESPYIFVDGIIRAGFDAAPLEIRTLRAKALNAMEEDHWSPWTRLTSPSLAPIHGTYHFQIRGASKPLTIEADFENGIMSIPQIFAGANTIHFKLRDANAISGPVTVTYKYLTASGERIHTKRLRPSDFRGNQATYTVEAPGLIRCNSLAISY